MCWGENWEGEHGNGSTNSSSTPVVVSGGHQWKWIEAGEFYTVCGIRTDNVAMCWGGNLAGEFGNGTYINSLVPVAVPGDLRWKSISVGDAYVCGIDTNDRGYCWGAGYTGELGNGETYITSVMSSISCSEPEATAGSIKFNSSYNVAQYCDGAAWVPIGKGGF
jgi:alpha-tubulin suppressor-like RCC1 family protein